MLMLTLFFESVCFPTIVALGMRGLGRHTKRGSGLIIAGVSGGAAGKLFLDSPVHASRDALLTTSLPVPPILAATADAHNSTAFAMVVPVCFFLVALSYAACVNFVPTYREPADKTRDSSIGIANSL